MVARLLGGMFGLKATVLSGALVVASAVATGSVPSTDAVVPAGPDLVAENASSVREESMPAAPAQGAAPVAAPHTVDVPRAAEPSTVPGLTPVLCAADAQVRDASLAKIRSSFASAHSALAQLGLERRSAKATTTIERAGTMLANVDRTAEELVGTSVSCAADLHEVSDRAVHAMEMIVDLAKTATAPTPTPVPTKKPIPTKKPEPTPKKR